MFKQESSSGLSPAAQSACLDPLDIDRYIDFDQGYHPSPAISPTSSRGKAISTPEFTITNLHHPHLPSQTSGQQTLTLPSHQYELYKQTTGLPVGALAAMTSAIDQPIGYSHQQNFALAPTDGYFGGMSSSNEFFDFNTSPSHNPSFSNSSDMDMDFDSPTRDLFMSSAQSQASATDYIDPNAIGGQEDSSNAPTPVQSNVGRLWPGMHQQQAAMAKAQAQAQQQKHQQHRQPPRMIQQPQTAQPSQSRQVVPRPAGNTSRPPTDPVVEERISRLLSQMRQSSVTSSNDDDGATPNANNGMSLLARQRKEDEDMDEDERLLASEEGKKLSSKERRQLRNKVSARAFRSRRKEYIGQLEGEVAVKAKEADDLRVENEALKAENTRLTDLTRMLLSSSAFSSFLNDLSNNGVPNVPAPTPTSSQAPTSITPPVQNRPRKDANPHKQVQQQQQSGAQVGMALIPEETMDFSVFDTTNAWAGNMDPGFNYAQVFSVTELPQGPAVDSIDIGILSGKSSNSVGSYSYDAAKAEAPVIERLPMPEEESNGMIQPLDLVDDINLDESDPAFALFFECASPAKAPSAERDHVLFGGIELEKAFARLDLVVDDDCEDNEDGVVSAAVMDRFERLCSSIEAASTRVAAVTSHL